MDRFEIAIHFKNQRKRIKAFHFPATRYAVHIEKYIEYCIKNEGIFIGDNVPESALEKAIISISKIYDTPVVVESESRAQMFTILNSYRVYSIEMLPPSKYALCYNCSENSLPFDVNIIGTIYNTREPFSFV